MGRATPKDGRESDSYDAGKAFEALGKKYKVTYNNVTSLPKGSADSYNETPSMNEAASPRHNRPPSAKGNGSSGPRRQKNKRAAAKAKVSSTGKRRKKKGQSLTYSRTKVHRLFRENLKEIRSGKADEQFYEELRSSAKATVPYGQYGAAPAKKMPSEPFIDPNTGEAIKRRCSNCTRSHFEGYCGQMGVCGEWEYSRPTPEWYPSRDEMKAATRKELYARHHDGTSGKGKTQQNKVVKKTQQKPPTAKKNTCRAAKPSKDTVESKTQTAQKKPHVLPKNNGAHSCNTTSDKWASIAKIMKDLKLEVVDNRSKGGALWVIGPYTLKPIMDDIKKNYGVHFSYAKKGGRASSGKPAWYTK